MANAIETQPSCSICLTAAVMIPAVSFLCPSQLDAVRFRQLFQRFSKTVHAGLLIVKLLWRLQLVTLQSN